MQDKESQMAEQIFVVAAGSHELCEVVKSEEAGLQPGALGFARHSPLLFTVDGRPCGRRPATRPPKFTVTASRLAK
jgi:hypothetical protein